MSFNCIDVSKFQKTVDWQKAKESGVSVGIFRAGYRGYLYGNNVYDDYALQNAKGIKESGIKEGMYFFSQAISESEAAEEADFCIDFAFAQGLSCPAGIWFDSELGEVNGNGRADNLTVAQRTACARAFVDRCREKGFIGGIYASTSWFNSKLDMSKLGDVPLWVADYRGFLGYQSDMIYGWQFSSSYILPYVEGNGGRTDTNYWYQNFKQQEESNMTKEPTKIKIGFASSGDIRTVSNKLNELQIPFTEENGFITTEINVSYGDKVTIEDLCKSLGIPCVEITENSDNEDLTEENTALKQQIEALKKENENLKNENNVLQGKIQNAVTALS